MGVGIAKGNPETDEWGLLNSDGQPAPSFSQSFRIRGAEVLPDQLAHVVTVANLMQETAGNHVVALFGRSEGGFAADPEMTDLGLIFVMTRLHIRMDTYPRWGSVVDLETWFEMNGRVRARRDWAIADAATNEKLGSATSTWVTVDTRTRRMGKAPDHIRQRWEQAGNSSPRFAMEQDSARDKLPDLNNPPEIRGPEQVARRTDMDMNGHINHVLYIAWVLETVPEDVWSGHRLLEVKLDFKAECTAGDSIESTASPLPAVNGNGSGREFVHALHRTAEDGSRQELIRAVTSWVPRDA